VLAQKAAIRPDKEDRAVERAPLPLDHPNDEMEARSTGDLAESVDGRPGHVNGAFVVTTEPLATLRRPDADPRPEVGALGITADERLGKNDQFGAVGGGLGGQLCHPVEGPLTIEGGRCRLDDRRADGPRWGWVQRFVSRSLSESLRLRA